MTAIIKDREFRIFWTSTTFNHMGEIMLMVVHGWLALQITGSAFWVGATAGLAGIGMMSFSILAGVLVDRWNKRFLIIGCHLVGAVLSFALAILILADRIQLWEILAFSLTFGVLVSVKIPSHFALTLDIVGPLRVMNGIAAISAGMTLMGIIGPILSGQIISFLEIGWAYIVIGTVFLISASLLIKLPNVSKSQKREETSSWADLKSGLVYAFNSPSVRMLLLMVLVSEAFGWSHESMLPIVARDVLNVGASGYGFLVASGSAGGAVSSLVLSSIGNVRNTGRLMAFCLGGFGLFLMLFATSTTFTLSLIFLFLAYACVVCYETLTTSVLQTIVPDSMRGRVLSLQTFMWGVTGLSGFHVGALASALGAPLSIGLGGLVVLFNAFRLRKPLWAIQISSSNSKDSPLDT